MKKLIERKNIQNIDDHITKSLCVCVCVMHIEFKWKKNKNKSRENLYEYHSW